MRDKKGFTYFELLATLAVVGVIILFARPVVNRIMRLARKNSFTSTNNELVNNLSDLCVLSEFDNSSISNTYTISDGKVLGLELSIKGELPESGTIIINNECNVSISTYDKNEEFCASKNFNDATITVSKVEEGNCVSKDIALSLVNETSTGTCYTYTTNNDGVIINGYKYDQEGCTKDLVIPTTIDNKNVVKIEQLAFVDPESNITIFEVETVNGEEKIVDAYAYKKGMSLKDNTYLRIHSKDEEIKSVVCNDGNNVLMDANYVHTKNDGYNYCYPMYDDKEENRYLFTGLDFSKAIYLSEIPYGLSPNSGIDHLVLNDKITKIGANAFKDNLISEIIIPDSLTSIGSFAFRNNSIYELDLNNVSYIGMYSFENNLIEGLTYKKIVEIPSHAFNNNRLGKLELSRDTNLIGPYAFSENPIPYVELTSSIKRIEKNAFNNEKNYEGSIKIITLNDNLEYIGYGAFKANGAENISLTYKITEIEPYAFASDGSLKELRLSKITTSIGAYAFYNNSLVKLEIPNTVTSIGAYAFKSNSNSLENLKIGNKVVSIGAYSFYGNNLSSLEIPDSVTSIGIGAFKDSNNLKTIKLGNSLKYISDYAFENSIIESIEIPSSVISIGSSAFKNEVKSIKNLKLNDGLQVIGPYAFYNNDLGSLEIPDSVTDIGEYAFMCLEPNVLSKLKLSNNMTTITNSSFYNILVKELVIPSSVTTIEDFAFMSESYIDGSISKLSLSSNLKTIGNSAFHNNGIKQLVIPDSVTELGESSFSTSAEVLEDLTIGKGLTRISAKAFSRNNIKVLNIPDNINYIDSQAFGIGKSLEVINIGSGIKKIAEDAFKESKYVTVNIDVYEDDITNNGWGISEPTINWKEKQE